MPEKLPKSLVAILALFSAVTFIGAEYLEQYRYGVGSRTDPAQRLNSRTSSAIVMRSGIGIAISGPYRRVLPQRCSRLKE